MQYNLLIKRKASVYNIFGVSEEQVKKIARYYLTGQPNITLSGKKYFLSEILEVKIFTYGLEVPLSESGKYYLGNVHYRRKKVEGGFYLPSSTLAKMGKNVTKNFVGDSEYGQELDRTNKGQIGSAEFVSEKRLRDLRILSDDRFDVKRLIRLCEELNSNYANQNYLSIGMISRTIINHIPPIFGFTSFDQIASNYGGPKENKSFKNNMKHLNESLKNIADSFLHQTIRKKEDLPTEIQIDFRADIDVLLGEIIRILK